MNYQIITNQEALESFIEWLPELEDNEKYYCSLFSRKKYCPDLIKSSDKTQLKRFISTKDRLLDKIRQLELRLGDWKLKNISAPQESLVVYINPNPRCMRKATFTMAKQCIGLIENNNQNYNIHAEALSCIQKSKSRSVVVDFDIDTKEIDLSKIANIIPLNSYDVLETRGGYHILVNPKKAPKTNWFKEIQDLFPVDQTGDNMIPIPGTYQGGFTPIFYN